MCLLWTKVSYIIVDDECIDVFNPLPIYKMELITVKCLKDNEYDYFTKGKIYEAQNGLLIDDLWGYVTLASAQRFFKVLSKERIKLGNSIFDTRQYSY